MATMALRCFPSYRKLWLVLAKLKGMTETMTSIAHVASARAGRYGKQLASHFSHKIEAKWDEENKTGYAIFPLAEPENQEDEVRCDMAAREDELTLTLTGPAAGIGRIEGVVARHLVRFGKQGELEVTFVRDNGETSTFVYEDGMTGHGK